MRESEINDLQTDNIATNFNASPNNVETSDELSLSESFFSKQDTNYAAAKREDERTKKVAAALSLGATALFGTAIFANAYLPSLPSVDKIAQSVVDQELHYSFVVSNNKKYSLTYTVSIKDEVLHVIDVSENKQHEGKITIVDYSLEMKISTRLIASLSDYQKTIGEYTIQGGSAE